MRRALSPSCATGQMPQGSIGDTGRYADHGGEALDDEATSGGQIVDLAQRMKDSHRRLHGRAKIELVLAAVDLD